MQGQVINGFVLKKLLGEGGMAEVWYAENEIGKPAAIKILNENLSHNQQIVERFHNEALVMVKLNHPNIRQVYGYGYLGERHCIIMEYLEGEDLEELMKNGRRFTEEELRRWWNQTVDALNYTHAMGIVHRDIKPSNIFLDEMGNIKLLDFGIAKMMENASLTQTGMVMGTPMYMSPEQVNDIKHVDYHTDLYSLAVSFVHMLTGKKPYDDTNCSVFEIQMSIVTKPLDMSEVPATWQDFLAPYLEKDPQKRPALRSFEAVQPAKKPATIGKDQAKKTDNEELKAAIVAPQSGKPVQEPQPTKPVTEAQPKQPMAKPQPSEPNEKPKSKVGLWIGVGVAMAAAVVVLIFTMTGSSDVESIMLEAQGYMDKKDYKKAKSLYTKAANKGNAHAQYSLGVLYEHSEELGLGNVADFENAEKWYRKSAEQGNVNGQRCMGNIYYYYFEDYEEAKKWCLMAANQGDVWSQNNLGEIYEYDEDYEEALKWYRRAAENGWSDSMSIDRMESKLSDLNKNAGASNSGGDNIAIPVHWKFEIKDRDNNEFDLVATAMIDPDYCIYSTTMPELGPSPTYFDIQNSEFFEAVGEARDLTDAPLYYDEIFETEYKQFSGTASFAQTFRKLKKGTFPVRGEITYQAGKDGMVVALSEDVNLMCQGITETEKPKPEVQITTTRSKNNVLYAGADNPIRVNVPGYDMASISISANNAEVKKQMFHEGEAYVLRPTVSSGQTEVTINANGKVLGKKSLRINALPNPTAVLLNVVDGKVSKNALITGAGVYARLHNFDCDGASFKVTGFVMKYKTKEGVEKECKSNGEKFSDEMKSAIYAANDGDVLVFTKIQVNGSDNTTRTLEDCLSVEISSYARY